MKWKLNFIQFFQNIWNNARQLIAQLFLLLKFSDKPAATPMAESRPDTAPEENIPDTPPAKPSQTTQTIIFEEEGMEIQCQVSKQETSELLQLLLRKFQSSSN